MGLFSSHKKLCPICGGATPRLFPRKFDDQPICKECEKKIDLPNEVLEHMSLNDFRQYLVAYAENEPLRASFQSTYNYGAFFLSKEMLALDEEHGLLRLKNSPSSWVIEKKHLKSFRILEDDKLLFENGSGELKCYPSDVPARAEALIPAVSAFYMEKRAFERDEQRERMHHSNESDEERWERERINNTYRPRFADPGLLREFRVEVTLDHCYWTSYENTESAPIFDDSYPSVEDYIKSYREKVGILHTLALRLMHMIDPDSGERQIGAAQVQSVGTTTAAAAAPADTVAEIKRYKELLEQGIITEEEFKEKKKQLLGI